MWFLHSGFRVLLRDDHRTVEETLDIVEKVLKLKENSTKSHESAVLCYPALPVFTAFSSFA